MAISLLRTQLASAWPCRGGCAGRRWRPSWARGEGHEEAQGPRCTPSPGGPAGHTAGPSGCRHCPAVSRPPSESAAKEMMGEEEAWLGRRWAPGAVPCLDHRGAGLGRDSPRQVFRPRTSAAGTACSLSSVFSVANFLPRIPRSTCHQCNWEVFGKCF